LAELKWDISKKDSKRGHFVLKLAVHGPSIPQSSWAQTIKPGCKLITNDRCSLSKLAQWDQHR